ncbi:hypothetical protein GCM10009533_51040 [Saccharopolyspora spinosporotrichia]|uniref:HTH marR-type domain-containing protein n=1 Tax=Saccharopolyspora erythraea TaxID=1836 RepID=A0ABN1DKH3_SACER
MRSPGVDALGSGEERERLLADASGVADALGRLARASGHLEAHASRHGADRVGYILLKLLATEGPLRSNALAEALHADPSTISRHVSQLVRNGLVERTVDPDDKRACPLAITAKGGERLADMRRRRDETLARLLESWPGAERAELARLLGRFVDEYERALPQLLTAVLEQRPFVGHAPETAPRGEN